MKKQYSFLKAFLMLIAVALFTGGSLYAQNTTITDNSSHTASTAAVLDVYSTTLGMLVPSLASDPTSTANGLFYYNTTSNVFKYYKSSAWKTFGITDDNDIYWTRNAGSGFLYTTNSGDKVGIGTSGPSTLLHVFDGGGTSFPQLFIENASATGDASERFSITGVRDYTLGIFYDNGGSDHNFKISNATTLSPAGYTQTNTMMEIHDENTKAGIIDFNHQSRARAYLNTSQTITTSTWQPIDFDNTNYDEHTEFTLVTGGPPASYFTATEEGYYQVNSRTEFFLGGEEDLWYVALHSYVSIAIYKGDNQNNWSMYSQGNNLQIGRNMTGSGSGPNYESFKWNNAPNVSDVVYLQAGEKIAIYAWQNSGISLDLVPGTAKTYVSIHKIS